MILEAIPAKNIDWQLKSSAQSIVIVLITIHLMSGGKDVFIVVSKHSLGNFIWCLSFN